MQVIRSKGTQKSLKGPDVILVEHWHCPTYDPVSKDNTCVNVWLGALTPEPMPPEARIWPLTLGQTS